MTLHPPFRFAIVEHELYRGSYPKERNFAFLSGLKLKTILSLTPNPPNGALLSFGANHSAHNIHISIDRPKENLPLFFSHITRILPIILNVHHSPMYIHCLDGTVVTGIVVACLRKLQYWQISAALTEYARFLSDDGTSVLFDYEEDTFLDKFQGDMEVRVDQLPKWFWLPSLKHPTMRIKWIMDKSFPSSQLSDFSNISQLVTQTPSGPKSNSTINQHNSPDASFSVSNTTSIHANTSTVTGTTNISTRWPSNSDIYNGDYGSMNSSVNETDLAFLFLSSAAHNEDKMLEQSQFSSIMKFGYGLSTPELIDTNQTSTSKYAPTNHGSTASGHEKGVESANPKLVVPLVSSPTSGIMENPFLVSSKHKSQANPISDQVFYQPHSLNSPQTATEISSYNRQETQPFQYSTSYQNKHLPAYPKTNQYSTANGAQSQTSMESAALKAEKEQWRQRHLDLGVSMSRRDIQRKDFANEGSLSNSINSIHTNLQNVKLQKGDQDKEKMTPAVIQLSKSIMEMEIQQGTLNQKSDPQERISEEETDDEALSLNVQALALEPHFSRFLRR